MKKESIEILNARMREEKVQYEITKQETERRRQLEQEEKDILISEIKDFFKDIPTDHEFIIWLKPNIKDQIGYDKLVIDNYGGHVNLYLLNRKQVYYRLHVTPQPTRLNYPSLEMMGLYQLITIKNNLDWIENVLVTHPE